MIDIVDPLVRSRMMARIRGKDTKPELILRRALHAQGFRYRLHDRRLAGAPDIVLRKFKAACFVHGCFWHRHDRCLYMTNPTTRTEFWQEKFRATVERDRRVKKMLLADAWRVAIIWECSLRGKHKEKTITEFASWLRSDKCVFETTLIFPSK